MVSFLIKGLVPATALPLVLATVLGGFCLPGCGAGSSAIYFTSGLFPLDIGTGGGTIPPPTDGGDDDGGGGGGVGTGTTICITFVNNANEDARVALYASSDLTISLQNLVNLSNVISLPTVDQPCVDVDDLVGPLEISPLIIDGLALNYQIECGLIASLAVSAIQVDATVINPDETTGPFRLSGIDFSCGDNVIINVTDTDVDDDFEIGP